MYADKALEVAQQQADEAAAALLASAITPAELKPVHKCTAGQRVAYSLRTTPVTYQQVAKLDTATRAMFKRKLGHCRSYSNPAFDAGQYDSLEDMLLVEKVAMLLRLVNMDHPVAGTVKGMLWETQRRYGTHEPVMEAACLRHMKWDGTWMGALAMWLA